MGFRIINIRSRVKLEHRLNYLVIRGETEKKIHISEINTLILQSTAVSLTASLLAVLVENNVKVIFCDKKCNPVSELMPYYGTHNSSGRLAEQINWDKSVKDDVWQEIVQRKIISQAEHLSDLGFSGESDMLLRYVDDVEPGDITNREGHAAKVYFNALFGKSFSRGQENPINAALNYGYGLILSAFNREVTMNGYLTHIGLRHDNMFNPYNLSCDLMEPFRTLIDRAVIDGKPADFGKEEKQALLAVLHSYVYIAGTKQTVLNAVKIYTRSVFESMAGGSPEGIHFFEI